MKIVVASLGDPKKMSTWSGIPAHIINALEKNSHEVIPITLVPPTDPWYYTWVRRVFWHLQKRWFLASVERNYLKGIAKQLDYKIATVNPNVVLVIHGELLAYTSFLQPAYIIHDTTFFTLVNYYPAYTNLTSRSVKIGNKMYKQALERATGAIFSSNWASHSAVKDYHISQSKVFTIPFGANLIQVPKSQDVKDWIIKRSCGEMCNLLFLGIDWERKGGPDSLRFVAELNRLGLKSQLTIVGCLPHVPSEMEQYVNVIGYLNKDIPSEATQLETVLKESQALLLPSLFECYGCVYCEANAYGLPALGRYTGGVPEIIKDGINGLLLMNGETPESFAVRWAAYWTNPQAYHVLSIQSRKEFDEKLNYEAFIYKLEAIIENVSPTTISK